MKHIFQFLGAAAVMMACGTGGGGSDTRTVQVRIEGAGGRTLYFDRFSENAAVHVDSVVLDASGAGTMHIAQLPLDFYRIALSDAQQTILALDSTDDVTVEAKIDSMMTPSVVKGSKASEVLHDYYRKARRYESELAELRRGFDQGVSDPGAMARMEQVNREYAETSRRFIEDNPGSPGLLSAVSKLNMQQEFETYVKVRDQLSGPMAKSGFYRAFRENVDRMQQQMAAQKAQEEQMKQMGNLVPVGGLAPDFSQQTPDGRTLTLSQLRGKVVLVDFWASWCRPCRMENPSIVAAYNKYKNKGFDVLGVSLDRDRNAWLAAIEKDGLKWNHVSDLQWWNNAAAQQYGVSSIPYCVLIDKDGKVIEKNLRGPALEAKLAEIFGS